MYRLGRGCLLTAARLDCWPAGGDAEQQTDGLRRLWAAYGSNATARCGQCRGKLKACGDMVLAALPH